MDTEHIPEIGLAEPEPEISPVSPDPEPEVHADPDPDPESPAASESAPDADPEPDPDAPTEPEIHVPADPDHEVASSDLHQVRPAAADADATPEPGIHLPGDPDREAEASDHLQVRGAATPEALSDADSEAEPEDFTPPDDDPNVITMPVADAELKAVLEAIIYVTDEPLTLDQICAGLEQPRERVLDLLEQLAGDYEQNSRGLTIKEIAGGFKMATKPEHHDAVRRFVKNLNPPLKLSLPALETLAVIAYKQPITAPEIMEIRGVQGAGVLKTLIDRKLIATAGRKQVVGKPILYKTTREFLVQFGLKNLAELPTLKEFQDIGRMDTDAGAPAEAQHTPSPSEPLLFPRQDNEEAVAEEQDIKGEVQ